MKILKILKTVLKVLLRPLEYLYLAGLMPLDGMRASGLLRSKKLPAPVVSIGNLTVGGTGKTPSSMRFAEEAVARGFRPVILTRGYGGRAKGPAVVSDGKGPLIDASMAGDEAYLMARSLAGIPIIKCPNRYKGGCLAHDLFHPDLYILDDGFQHRALERNVDIVLIDGSRPFINERLLPVGRLREPLKKALGRADEVIITKTSPLKINGLKSDVAGFAGDAPQVSVLKHQAVSLVDAGGNTQPVAKLSGRRVLAFSGIANPEYFRSMLVASGADVIKFISFSDHYRYGRRDLERIRAEAEAVDAYFIVTTEKDLVKLPSEGFWALRIKVEFEADMLNRVFSRLSANG